MVVVAIVIWMSTVSAEIRIQSKRDPVSLKTSVEIAKSPEQGQLQGRVVEGIFDKIQEFAVKEQTASSVIATTTGRVRITNKYSKDQTLIRTTRLLSPDGKLFRINANVNVPSGGTVEVNANSDQTGSSFAIPNGTTFVIPGLWIDLQKLITAEAITPFTGTAEGTKIVTAEEVDNAQKTLEEAVLAEAKKTLAAEANVPADKIADSCPNDAACWSATYVVETLEKKSNVTVGQNTDSFLAQDKIKVTAVYYPRKDMDLLVSGKLKEQLPEGRDLVDVDLRNVAFTLEQTDTKVEKARIGIKIEAYSRLTAQNPALARDQIAGLSLEDAKAKLRQVEGAEFVEITLRPSWARNIPRQKDKIKITIE